MVKSWHLNRRKALQGIGVSLALPLLECMQTAQGNPQVDQPQARMAFLYFPNGVAEGSWLPEEVSKDGSLVKLNSWMQPLELSC